MKPLPKHIAVIMDGNGRWAKKQNLPRLEGHRAGVEAVRRIIKACGDKHIQVLTLFAFSSENWARPTVEVNDLMGLFLTALRQEIAKLCDNNVLLKIIGDIKRFDPALQREILAAEKLTENNTGLTLVIAANYGGHWDITQASRALALQVEQGRLRADDITVDMIASKLCLAQLPPPDLFIRTSGEQRISNFLLWQLAYTELYFTETLWPDFSDEDFEAALNYYALRERRFGTIMLRENSALYS